MYSQAALDLLTFQFLFAQDFPNIATVIDDQYKYQTYFNHT